MIVVIDCKKFSKKINVKTVESFLGMLDDVGAHRGIMITNIGYTASALNRAENDIRDLTLDIVEFSKLDDYHFILDSCEACMQRFILGEISWELNELVLKKRPKISVLQGSCDTCGSVYYKCCQCGLFIEKEEMNSTECSCGNQFRLTEAYIRHGMTEDRIELKVSR